MSVAALESDKAREISYQIYRKLEPLYLKPLPVAEARQLVLGLFDIRQKPYCDAITAQKISEALQKWAYGAVRARRADPPMAQWYDLLRRVNALFGDDYPVQAAEVMLLAHMVYNNIMVADHHQALQQDESIGFMRPSGVFYQILQFIVTHQGASQRWLRKALHPVVPFFCDNGAAKLASMGLLEQVQWEPFPRYIPTRRGEIMLQKTRPAWWKRHRK